MDEQAINDLYKTLKAQGFTGKKKPFVDMLRQAEDNTDERRVLSFWRGMQSHRQHAALLSGYNHARKHGLSVVTFDNMHKTSLVFSRKRPSKGVYLARLEVSQAEMRLSFYKGREFFNDRVVQL